MDTNAGAANAAAACGIDNDNYDDEQVKNIPVLPINDDLSPENIEDIHKEMLPHMKSDFKKGSLSSVSSFDDSPELSPNLESSTVQTELDRDRRVQSSELDKTKTMQSSELNTTKTKQSSDTSSFSSVSSQSSRNSLSEQGEKARQWYQSSGYGTGSANESSGSQDPCSRKDSVFSNSNSQDIHEENVPDNNEGEALGCTERDTVSACANHVDVNKNWNISLNDDLPKTVVVKHSNLVENIPVLVSEDGCSSSFYFDSNDSQIQHNFGSHSVSTDNNHYIQANADEGRRESETELLVKELQDLLGESESENDKEETTFKDNRISSLYVRDRFKSLGCEQILNILVSDSYDVAAKQEKIQEMQRMFSVNSINSIRSPEDSDWRDFPMLKKFFAHDDEFSTDFQAGEFSNVLSTRLKLERTKRCKSFPCSDPFCMEIKSHLKQLQSTSLKVDNLNEDQKEILSCVCDHCIECDELKCPFSWCSYLSNSQEQTDQKHQLQCTKQAIEGSVATASQWTQHNIARFSHFNKMDTSVLYDTVPQLTTDWSPLCRVGSSRTVLALAFGAQGPLLLRGEGRSSQLWVMSLIPSLEDETLDWQIRLFSKMFKLKHDNIAKYLWLSSVDPNEMSGSYGMLLCSQFEGSSLFEHIQSQPLQDIVACSVILQLISATHHLHSIGILYLNWSSSNVILSEKDQGVVKLVNFSSSVLVEEGVDDGYHPSMLPLHLWPPEFLSSGTVNEASDVWGLACLLKELLSTQPVWNDCRHDEDIVIKEKMRCSEIPNIPSNVSRNMASILHACLKVEPYKRISLGNLEKEVLALFQQQDGRPRCDSVW